MVTKKQGIRCADVITEWMPNLQAPKFANA